MAYAHDRTPCHRSSVAHFLLHPRIDRLDEAMRLTDLRERGSHHQFLSRQNTILSRPVKNSPFSGKSLARISLQLANRRFVQLEVDSEIIWLLTLKKFPIPCSHTSLPIHGAARNCLPFSSTRIRKIQQFILSGSIYFSYLLCLRREEKSIGLSWNRTQVFLLHK